MNSEKNVQTLNGIAHFCYRTYVQELQKLSAFGVNGFRVIKANGVKLTML